MNQTQKTRKKERQLTQKNYRLHSQQKRLYKTLNFTIQNPPLEIKQNPAIISDSECFPETERPKQKAKTKT